MLILGIDTSTTAISVALHDGDRVVAQATTLDARAHAEHLAPGIRAALDQAGAAPRDVTGVVVGIGPGPFTGLRVGIVSGRTFAFALGLPVHGLCSLDALAHEAWLGGHRGGLLVATDARRKEVYAAEFLLDEGGLTRLAGPVVSRAAELQHDWRRLPIAGRGPLLYPADLPGPPEDGSEPSGIPLPRDVSAGALADLAVRRLADGDPADPLDGLEPLYLRRPDVSKAPPSQKSTLG
ncbi:tRNA (adenosine(37)-N6)-threonylcarbamoyltransferase complex dimerization subunit type 1 TsaB [Intrasporangium calvum]|uniref:tRNA (Adenosine(37)-N6)-threonylcarbamoyltransferase complex dimerization subunit type 1 TsaB n=1 Tax=Intrasporangium calvum TaxID=53358 RepID=A0ABT5GGV8_9MICO|nr:tRNA (adenosine(37)-N6)-threonylcarbamoyltransferase complex dimerization subunit type 1 TsaB [Intrasporangium calvum]MDC5696946.1 tRNA (adenosine(37)-N6)-threonylcarbamoyltransferase complex dimerization subunit type 1 TsaB [Intrasporangium calvum]